MCVITKQNIAKKTNTSQSFLSSRSKKFAINDLSCKQFINSSTESLQVAIPKAALEECHNKVITNENSKLVNYDDNPKLFEQQLAAFISNLEAANKNPQSEQLSLPDKNTRGQYRKKKFDLVALAFYKLAKVNFARSKNNQVFEGICINQIASMADCNYKTALTHIKALENLSFIQVMRSKAIGVGKEIVKTPRHKYIINIKKIFQYLLGIGLIELPKKRNLHTNKYKKEIIINPNAIFYLNGKKIVRDKTQSYDFIEKHLDDLIEVAIKFQTKMKIKCFQVKNIIETFKKVTGNQLKDNQELTRMVLGWIKNRYNQILTGNKANAYSMWGVADDFIEYNGTKLCDNFVLVAKNSTKTAKNYMKIAENELLNRWEPSRDLIYNKANQVKNIIKHKIPETTFFKILGSMMISSKLKNPACEEYLL